MKKIVLFLILITGYASAKCQLDKGTWLAGGSGSFYSYKENYTATNNNVQFKYADINAFASIGYFFTDKVAVGMRPTFSSLKGHGIGTSEGISTHSIQYAIGPFARYYFLKADNPYNLLADVSYQLGSNYRLGGLHEKGKYNAFSFMVGPELYFNTAVGIEFLFGYTQKTTSIENSSENFNSVDKGFQASIGFQFHLQKD